MPELPEVEVTRLSLGPHLDGRRIEAIVLGKPLRWPMGIDSQKLLGKTVQGVSRRGKYLIFSLDAGVLLVHLGMSGSLRLQPRTLDDLKLSRHEHFGLRTAEFDLILLDPRRFGAVVWGNSLADERVAKLISTIGVEPFDAAFTAETLYKGLKESKVAVKQLLLAGKLVCGVGNIYASETLFLAKVRPTRAANKLSKPEAQRLFDAVQLVLGQAIQAGGSSLRDFKSASGDAGHFQTQTRVYGREGGPCYVCGSPVRMIKQGQRSSYFCAVCQKR